MYIYTYTDTIAGAASCCVHDGAIVAHFLLTLRFCNAGLGSIHTLELTGCTGVVDVSKLGAVHTLVLSGCSAVTDISALGVRCAGRWSRAL